MKTSSCLLKIVLVGLLVFSLFGCSSGVKLKDTEVKIYIGQTINPKDYLSDDDKDNSKIVIENRVNFNKEGTYEIVYKLNGIEEVLEVTILGDPITLLKESIILETGSRFDPNNYISIEDRGNDIQITSNVEHSKKGEYIVIYSCGGIEKVLNVSVKEVELLLKQNTVAIDLGSTFSPRTFLNGSFPESDKIQIQNPVDINKVGTYTVKYTLGTVSKSLKVMVNDVSPILTTTTVSVKQGSVFDPKNYLILSDRTNTNINITSNVNTAIAGSYTVTYQLNSITKTLQVTVTKVTTVTSYTLKVTSVTSPVDAGEYATVEIQGKAEVLYTILVYYKSGVSTAAGLEPQIADDSGRASWTWKVGTRTTPGSWKIVISGGGKSTTVYFTVT